MPVIHTIVIGGGQAGLAMSGSLTRQGVEHVVLERGRVGERWRSERWDSLHLLTPRWLSRVSGWSNGEADPHGFMDRTEVIRYLESFAASLPAPVHEGVTVLRVEPAEPGYRVVTDAGAWTAANVVIATGESQDAFVPAMAQDLAADIQQVLPTRYRNPDQLPDGGVLVVGASATGIQLAAEIHASGRPVTVSAGRHTRLPRTYRGRDILAWFHDMGVLDERADDVPSLRAAKAQPSMQLTGSCDHRTLDLGVLQAQGVRLVGRARSISGRTVSFENDLVETIAAAEVKLARLRLRIDRYIDEHGLARDVASAEPFVPVPMPDAPTALDLGERGIRAVLWATGFRRSYPWLRAPVLDSAGELLHDGGITPLRGLHVLGLNFLRRRSSSFLGGVGSDADEIARHIAAMERGRRRAAPLAVA
jgi:putative flavoprotein involved in K+ transport